MGSGRCGWEPCCADKGHRPCRTYRPYRPSRRKSHPATVWGGTEESPDVRTGREEGAIEWPSATRSSAISARTAVGARWQESRARAEGSDSTSPATDQDCLPEKSEKFRVSRRSEEGCCLSCCASVGRREMFQWRSGSTQSCAREAGCPHSCPATWSPTSRKTRPITGGRRCVISDCPSGCTSRGRGRGEVFEGRCGSGAGWKGCKDKDCACVQTCV